MYVPWTNLNPPSLGISWIKHCNTLPCHPVQPILIPKNPWSMPLLYVGHQLQFATLLQNQQNCIYSHVADTTTCLFHPLHNFSCYDSVHILTCLCGSHRKFFFCTSLYKWISVIAPVSSMYLLNSLSPASLWSTVNNSLRRALSCYSSYGIVTHLSKYKLHLFTKVMLLQSPMNCRYGKGTELQRAH
jgi:hypothetical protein